MSNVLIIAPTMRAGEEYAREHGLDPRCVVTPRSTKRSRGFVYDDFVIVGDTPLDVYDWAAITPMLVQAGEEVLDRFQWEVLGKLPPPIELEAENVIRF